MSAFLLRRLGASVLLVLLILTFTFFFVHLAPGDPAAVLVAAEIDPGHQQELRRVFGLDRALHGRYLAWLKAVAIDFDWGISFTRKRPVTEVVGRYLPNTLLLAGSALAIRFIAGLLLGVVAARRPGSKRDRLIRVGSLLTYALPTFWLAVMAVLLFSHTLPLFPPAQMRSLGAEGLSWGRRLVDLLHHLALPALVLGLAGAGGIARYARASVLEALSHDYIRTARAQGLAPGRVVWVHALRNGLSPLVQLFGLSLPVMLSSALVVEVVFAWPGMGRMTFEAIGNRDYPVILAGTAVAGVMVVVGNLVADLLQAAVDPRVRDG